MLGPPACQLVGEMNGDVARINLFNPGEDIANLGIADPSRSLVLVAVEGE
jgi:hypothetical protein